MKTGNTGGPDGRRRLHLAASMEPGHEDREYAFAAAASRRRCSRLNGARS